MRLYLVAYDVTLPKRWRKVYRTMQDHGDWLQYSVFVCRMTKSRGQRLRARLEGLIDPETDRVTVVDLGPLPLADDRLTNIGRTLQPAEGGPWII